MVSRKSTEDRQHCTFFNYDLREWQQLFVACLSFHPLNEEASQARNTETNTKLSSCKQKRASLMDWSISVRLLPNVWPNPIHPLSVCFLHRHSHMGWPCVLTDTGEKNQPQWSLLMVVSFGRGRERTQKFFFLRMYYITEERFYASG